MNKEEHQTPLSFIKVDRSKMSNDEIKDIARIFYNLSEKRKPVVREGPEPIGDIVSRVMVDIARRVDLTKQLQIYNKGSLYDKDKAA